jgi:large subunit ribosomal protein L10
MKSKQQKKKELIKLQEKLSKAKILIFTTFAREGEKGLGVGDLRALKKDLRASDSEYIVGKKTLFNKALVENPSFVKTSEGKQKNVDVFQYPGSLGIVFGYGGEAEAAKSVYNFAKKNPALKYFGAFWNREFMDFAEFTEFASLPSRDVLIARFLGMLKYPLSALAVVLNQIANKATPIRE